MSDSFDLGKGFYVQKKMCTSCIYRPDNPLDLEHLESEVKDEHGFFNKHRQCHHTGNKTPACCRGFWNKHKDDFAGGQIAQRLNAVIEVDVDIL
jgi:hypothetical protein